MIINNCKFKYFSKHKRNPLLFSCFLINFLSFSAELFASGNVPRQLNEFSFNNLNFIEVSDSNLNFYGFLPLGGISVSGSYFRRSVRENGFEPFENFGVVEFTNHTIDSSTVTNEQKFPDMDKYSDVYFKEIKIEGEHLPNDGQPHIFRVDDVNFRMQADNINVSVKAKFPISLLDGKIELVNYGGAGITVTGSEDKEGKLSVLFNHNFNVLNNLSINGNGGAINISNNGVFEVKNKVYSSYTEAKLNFTGNIVKRSSEIGGNCCKGGVLFLGYISRCSMCIDRGVFNFSNNMTDGFGGVFFVSDNSILELKGKKLSFTNNSAIEDGACLFSDGQVNIEGTKILFDGNYTFNNKNNKNSIISLGVNSKTTFTINNSGFFKMINNRSYSSIRNSGKLKFNLGDRSKVSLKDEVSSYNIVLQTENFEVENPQAEERSEEENNGRGRVFSTPVLEINGRGTFTVNEILSSFRRISFSENQSEESPVLITEGKPAMRFKNPSGFPSNSLVKIFGGAELYISGRNGHIMVQRIELKGDSSISFDIFYNIENRSPIITALSGVTEDGENPIIVNRIINTDNRKIILRPNIKIEPEEAKNFFKLGKKLVITRNFQVEKNQIKIDNQYKNMFKMRIEQGTAGVVFEGDREKNNRSYIEDIVLYIQTKKGVK